MSKLSRWIDKNITHKSATREAMQAAKEQIGYYQELKDQMHAENTKLNQQKEIERKKIHEKQIRALGRRFRSERFLSGGAGADDVKSTLG